MSLSSWRRSRENEPITDPGGTDMSDPVPLSHLLLEGLGDSLYGPSIEALQAQITAQGHPVIVDYVGRRCVSRDVARILLAEHHQALQAQRQAAEEHRLELARHGNPYRQRVEALMARPSPEGVSALGVVMADATASRRAKSGEHMDEMLRSSKGNITYHPIRRDREAD
jgi:hypothetical protein